MAFCSQCTPNVFLQTAEEFVNHMKTYHYNGPSGRFQCPICFITHGQINRFKVHLNKCFSKQESAPKSKKTPTSISFAKKRPFDNCPSSQELNNYEASSPSFPPQLECNKKQSFHELFESIALNFSLSLHSQANFTRKDVFNIQTLITKNILQKLSELLLETHTKCNCLNGQELVAALKSIPDIFESVRTEHLLKSTLHKKELIVPPQEFLINREVGICFENRKASFGLQDTTGTLLPLDFQIHEFVKRNRRIEEMIANLEKYSKPSDNIRHYVQGTTWKSMISKVPVEKDTVYLPIGLYNDGLQYNNSLGSHTDSVDHLYYYFPLLEDPFHRNNIHMAASLRSNHIKNYGNGKCFQKLVDILLELYNVGFKVQINGKEVKVKFLLGIIIGDNLALNAILEYVISFKANYFCRICVLSKEEAARVCQEVFSKLRSVEEYKTHLLIN